MGIRVADTRRIWHLMAPEDRWALMSAEERALFPEFAPTALSEPRPVSRARATNENIAPGDICDELEHQKALCTWLEAEGWAYWYSGTHKKTSTKLGTPDYCFGYRGRILALEIKGPGGILSEAQRAFAAALARRGVELQISHSYQESLALIAGWMDSIDKELKSDDIS